MDETQHDKISGQQELDGELSQAREHLVYIGARIRKFRTEKGYSQESFALMIGLARSYYGGLERGERNCSIILLLKIAAGLQVDASILLPPLSSYMSLYFEGERANEHQVPELTVEREPTQTMQAMTEASYVGAEVAAKILGASRRTILRWVAEGKLDATYLEKSNGQVIAMFHRETLLKRRGSE